MISVICIWVSVMIIYISSSQQQRNMVQQCTNSAHNSGHNKWSLQPTNNSPAEVAGNPALVARIQMMKLICVVASIFTERVIYRSFVRSADVSSGRRFVRMTFRQDGRTTLDVLSGLCLTTLDVLSGRIHVRRFVRKTFCQ